MSASHDIPELDPAGLRKFALTSGAIVAGLFGLLLPWLLGLAYPLAPWIVAAVLVAWGLAAPATLRPVYVGWMRFGLVMNRITTPLLLGTIFYAVFTPTALLMKAAGRDLMRRHFEKSATTYRIASQKAPRDKMERPF